MAKRRKKTRTHVEQTPENQIKVPKSLVLLTGKYVASLQSLVRDFRRVMEPHTASRLKVQKKNTLKDFVTMAGPLGVTHFIIFRKSDDNINLRIARVPRGPTMYFRVHSYSLARDVLNSQKRPHSPGAEFKTAPLVVLNNFPENKLESKLMTTMFQNMFPSINVKLIKLADARRVLLFSYNAENQHIEFRQYVIHVQHVGISKGIKRLIQMNVPNLNSFEDIGDFILREAHAAESDVEDPDTRVTLRSNYVGKDNKIDKKENETIQRSVRLEEIGPRLELELTKVEKEFCDGEVLYHHQKTRTDSEIKQLRIIKQTKLEEKAHRRKIQEENVEKKKSTELLKKRKIDNGNQDEDQDNTTNVDDDTGERSFDEAEDSDNGSRREPLNIKKAPLLKAKRVGRVFAKARKSRT